MSADTFFDEGGVEALGASKKSAALVTAAATAIASIPPSRNNIASSSAGAHLKPHLFWS